MLIPPKAKGLGFSRRNSQLSSRKIHSLFCIYCKTNKSHIDNRCLSCGNHNRELTDKEKEFINKQVKEKGHKKILQEIWDLKKRDNPNYFIKGIEEYDRERLR